MSSSPGSGQAHAAYQPMNEILQDPIAVCIPAQRQITAIHYMSTVTSAFQTLCRARVLSAPVMKPNKLGAIQWVALVSYHDLLRFIASQSDRDQAMNATLEQVIAAAGSPPLQVEERTRILDVIQFLSSIGRMHRCIVKLDHDPRGYSIVSQSDVNRFVVSRLFSKPELKPFADVRLVDLGFTSRNPVSIFADATLSDAIQTLTQKNVSCLAITDPKQAGRLIGNFSPSDLRGFGEELVKMFSEKVVDILKRHSSDSLNPVSVSATESLGVLMARMANGKLHHVWIQDPDGRPEGLITLTDICNLLIKFTPLPEQK